MGHPRRARAARRPTGSGHALGDPESSGIFPYRDAIGRLAAGNGLGSMTDEPIRATRSFKNVLIKRPPGISSLR
jgi:hypothetical protein